MSFQLMSPAFENGGLIPDMYSDTRWGRNSSPPLQWENPPAGTRCFALIAEDIDPPLIGLIPHWVLYNIPQEKRELAAALPRRESFTDGMLQGRNFYRQHGYMGPNPPFGPHRYLFKLYALDAPIPPDSKMNRKTLLKAMEGHILGQTELMGRYARKRY